MPFVYDVAPAANFTTNATPNTETVHIAYRQTNRGFKLVTMRLLGKVAQATNLTAIAMRFRLWTTAGSAGSGVTPSPRRGDIPAATTVCATAPTAGTVSGAYQLVTGCSKTGPGGWTARDEDDKIEVPGNTADEIDGYSISAEASLTYEFDSTIEE